MKKRMKTMKNTIVAALCVLILAAPAVADPWAGTTLFRDSDGIVISILHPVDYLPIWDGIKPGEVYYYYTFRGDVLEMASATGGGVSSEGLSSSVAVDGTTYEVEVSGTKIWLKDPANGRRFAAERRIGLVAPDAKGLRVNPTVFALD